MIHQYYSFCRESISVYNWGKKMQFMSILLRFWCGNNLGDHSCNFVSSWLRHMMGQLYLGKNINFPSAITYKHLETIHVFRIHLVALWIHNEIGHISQECPLVCQLSSWNQDFVYTVGYTEVWLQFLNWRHWGQKSRILKMATTIF